MLKALHLELVRVLSRHRFDLADEKACQAEIHTVLTEAFPERSVQRERHVGLAEIVDFYVDGVAIEVKMNRAQAAAIIRQIKRYAKRPDVTAVIVATNKALQLPKAIEGKPIYGVSLGRAWL